MTGFQGGLFVVLFFYSYFAYKNFCHFYDFPLDFFIYRLSRRYIRILKSLGIAIYFEEQNINTLTEDSETYIGIYGVLAQAESENISQTLNGVSASG